MGIRLQCRKTAVAGNAGPNEKMMTKILFRTHYITTGNWNSVRAATPKNAQPANVHDGNDGNDGNDGKSWRHDRTTIPHNNRQEYKTTENTDTYSIQKIILTKDNSPFLFSTKICTKHEMIMFHSVLFCTK